MQGIEVREFGGLYSLTDPTNIPHFMSPDCADVEFLPGLVRSRFGFKTVLTAPPGTTTINYVKSFILPNGNLRTLFSDSNGNMWYEDATSDPGNSHQIFTPFLFGAFPNSVTQFGREYIVIGDGQKGLDIPRQYDGTNFDRISQEGPGASPSVSDDTTIYAIDSAAGAASQTAPTAITSISMTGNVVTVTTAGNWGFGFVNESVTIAGVAVGGYNGTFPVATVSGLQQFTYILGTIGLSASSGGTVTSHAAQFKTTSSFFSNLANPLYFTGLNAVVAGVGIAAYNGTWPILGIGRWGLPAKMLIVVNITNTGTANSANGTFTVSGNVDAGTHLVSVMFLTRSRYLTRPAPWSIWVSGGNKRGFVTNIPIGPPNVIARYLLFTPIASENFYFITTQGAKPPLPLTTIVNDNSSIAAFVNFHDTDLLNGTLANDFFELITLPPCSGIAQYSSRMVVTGALNTIQNMLNLGFDGGFSQDTNQCPLGWTPDPINYLGGAPASTSVFGGGYSITGTGAGPIWGLISQNAFQDFFGQPILSPNTAYTIAAQFKSNNDLTGATISILLVSPSTGYSQGLNLTSGITLTNFQLFSANCSALPSTVPSDLQIQIFAAGMTALQTVYIDDIRIYPTANPVASSLALVSKAEDAESYDGLTGILEPTAENGQSVHSAFVIRDYLYLVKDRSLFITMDNGNEPASGETSWSLDEVSSRIGSQSIRGVGVGDEWATIASESGFWYFTGGLIAKENNLANEIQPTWNSINWAAGQLVDVKVDTKAKKIYILCPIGSSTNNTILVLNYLQGFGDPIANNGIGRKWTIWKQAANSHNMIVRPDGTLAYYIGCQAGQVRNYDNTQINDANNSPINAYWQSGYFQGDTRLNYGYVQANIVGSGSMNLLLRKGDQSWATAIRGWTLSPLGYTNVERQIQKQGYRMAIRFGISALDTFFSIQGLTMYVTESMWAPVRGVNA